MLAPRSRPLPKPIALSDRITLSPYLNLAQVWLRTNAVHETGNVAALDIARQSNDVRLLTLGMRSAFTLLTRTPMHLTADFGWVHAFGDTDSHTVNRFAAGSIDFTIRGVGIEHNVALLGFGLRAQLAPNIHLHTGYQGQFASKSKHHTAQMQLKVRF